MPPDLKSATLYLTDTCNSRCRTCAVWQNRRGTWHPLEVWQDVLGQLAALGIRHVAFCGGEPLLREDITELAATGKAAGIPYLEIVTNGLALSPQLAQRLVAAGVRRFTLSVDGLKATHDRIRGVKGAFERVSGALAFLAAMPVEVAVCTNLHAGIAADLPAVIQMADRHGALWIPNILNDRQYYFRGIRRDGLFPSDPGTIEALVGGIAAALQQGQKVGIAKRHLPFLARALAGDPQVPPACILGDACLYVNADLEVFTGCTVLPPVGSLKAASLGRVVASDAFRRQVERMRRRQCPGCTCGFFMNIDHSLAHGDDPSHGRRHGG